MEAQALYARGKTTPDWHDCTFLSLWCAFFQASEDDCGDFEISEDVIRQYKANEQVHARERLALRQTLRQKFESMQQRNLVWQEDAVTDMLAACKDASATVHA